MSNQPQFIIFGTEHTELWTKYGLDKALANLEDYVSKLEDGARGNDSKRIRDSHFINRHRVGIDLIYITYAELIGMSTMLKNNPANDFFSPCYDLRGIGQVAVDELMEYYHSKMPVAKELSVRLTNASNSLEYLVNVNSSNPLLGK